MERIYDGNAGNDRTIYYFDCGDYTDWVEATFITR